MSHDHDHAHHDHHHQHGPLDLMLFSPSGLALKAAPVRLAARRLTVMGLPTRLDESALARRQRFAGDDETRLAAIHRVADEAPAIAMAVRGGYGLTRLLDGIDWKRVARSVDKHGTRWVGYSDLTALQMGLLAHTGAPSWCGPMAADDFGREVLDEVTPDCFAEAMRGELEAVGFRTAEGFDGLEARGTLWGGNLTVLLSLLGTPHWPQIKGGILFLEDVAEHPYRVERMLLQLHQAGVLARQKAVLLGAFSDWRPSPLDRGYGLKTAIAHLRGVCRTPILTGLPFGHVPTKVTMPLGRRVHLMVDGRQTYVAW